LTLKQQIAADKEIFFNEDDFAEAIVYNGESFLAVETVATDQNTGFPGFVVPVFTVLISSQDVSRPKAGDVVTFRGKVYKVGANPVSHGPVWSVDLVEKTIQV